MMNKEKLKLFFSKISKKGWIMVGVVVIIGLIIGKVVGGGNSSPKVPSTGKSTTVESGKTTGGDLNNKDEDLEEDTQIVSDKGFTGEYNEWLLIAGLAGSLKVQSMLVALYNPSLNEITYFPPDYYIGDYRDRRNQSLGNLTPNEIKEWFSDKGFNIVDTFRIDRDIIKDLYITVMAGEEYLIQYVDKRGKEVTQAIRGDHQLWEFLTSDITDKKILEQKYSTLLGLLAKNNLVLSEYFSDKNKLPFRYSDLYEEGKFHSMTDKHFIEESIKGKLFLVDENDKFLNSLKGDRLLEYQKYVEGIELQKKKKLEEEKKAKEEAERKRLEEEKLQLELEKQKLKEQKMPLSERLKNKKDEEKEVDISKETKESVKTNTGSGSRDSN